MRLKTNAGGDLAVYDETYNGNNPLSAPLSNIPALAFHSALEYPRVIATYTGSITLPAFAVDAIRTNSTAIVAHGQGGFPYIEGRVQIGAAWVPLIGSVVVAQATLNTAWARFLTLGVDVTNILLYEYTPIGGFPAVTLNYEIYLTDTLIA